MNKSDDQEILNGIVTGDEAIISQLYKDNLKYIRKYIIQNSGSEADVEDVFQDALVFVYQKLKADTLVLHASFRSYFYGVSKNIWRNRLRKSRKMVVTSDITDYDESIEEEIIDEIQTCEQEHLYQKHFVKLSESCRNILELVFQGKGMKEIATITGYSENYTRRKKFKCKEALLKKIESDPNYKELHTDSLKE